MGDSSGSKLGWKAFEGLVALVVAFATRKVLELAWTKVTGREPPETPEDPAVAWSEAAGWAMLSGVAVGLARLAASRRAALTWERVSGARPPGMASEPRG